MKNLTSPTYEEDIFQTVFRGTQKNICSPEVTNTWHKNCLKGGRWISVSASPAGCTDLQKSLGRSYTQLDMGDPTTMLCRQGRVCHAWHYFPNCTSVNSGKSAAGKKFSKRLMYTTKIVRCGVPVWGGEVTLYVV